MSAHVRGERDGDDDDGLTKLWGLSEGGRAADIVVVVVVVVHRVGFLES